MFSTFSEEPWSLFIPCCLKRSEKFWISDHQMRNVEPWCENSVWLHVLSNFIWCGDMYRIIHLYYSFNKRHIKSKNDNCPWWWFSSGRLLVRSLFTVCGGMNRLFSLMRAVNIWFPLGQSSSPPPLFWSFWLSSLQSNLLDDTFSVKRDLENQQMSINAFLCRC